MRAKAERTVTVKVKRAYEPPARADGCRVLVDRLWPRGLSREAAALDAWVKGVAPSAGLRKWFGHEPSRWDEFKRRYFEELSAQPDAIDELLGACPGATLTLVFGARDLEHNNAVALREYLERHHTPSR